MCGRMHVCCSVLTCIQSYSAHVNPNGTLFVRVWCDQCRFSAHHEFSQLAHIENSTHMQIDESQIRPDFEEIDGIGADDDAATNKLKQHANCDAGLRTPDCGHRTPRTRAGRRADPSSDWTVDTSRGGTAQARPSESGVGHERYNL